MTTTKTNIALAELAEKGADTDLLKQMIQYVAQRMMEMDAESELGEFSAQLVCNAAPLQDRRVLNAGVVAASDPLQETLARIDLPPALLERAGVVIEAVVIDHDAGDHLLQLDFAGVTLFVPARGQQNGSMVRCRIEARDVSLTLERGPISPCSSAVGFIDRWSSRLTPHHRLLELHVVLDRCDAIDGARQPHRRVDILA